MALMDVFTHFSIIRRERRGIRPEEIKIRTERKSDDGVIWISPKVARWIEKEPRREKVT